MAPLHLQYMLLCISIFDMKALYIQGKEIQVPDCLSNLIRANKDNQIKGPDMIIHDVQFTVVIEKQSNITHATAEDSNLTEAM